MNLFTSQTSKVNKHENCFLSDFIVSKNRRRFNLTLTKCGRPKLKQSKLIVPSKSLLRKLG